LGISSVWNIFFSKKENVGLVEKVRI